MLVGSLSLAKDESGRKAENISFKYILPNDGPTVKKLNGNNSNLKDTKSKLEELTEGLRDLKTSALSKLGKKTLHTLTTNNTFPVIDRFR